MRRVLILLALLLALVSAAPAAQNPVSRDKVTTVDPVLGQIAVFIGGPYLDVSSGWHWDARDVLRASRTALIGGANSTLPLLALDPAQYARFMSSTRRGRAGVLTKAEQERPNVRYLYPSGCPEKSAELFYADPASLPYTAQQVAEHLSELFPNRVSFFQRRLGEFNSRLRSLLIAGRRRLNGVKILCLSDTIRPFLAASGAVLSEPTPGELSLVRSLAQASSARSAQDIAERLRNGRLIVCDYRTEPNHRAALQRWPGAIYVAPPKEDDMLFALHNAMLDIGIAVDRAKIPQPEPKRRK